MTDTSNAAELTEITIKRYLCRHIHTSGRRCGSPALRGEQFCYYHHTTRRPGPRYRGVHPSAYDFEMPDLDDLDGIQFALAQVLSLIAANQLDPKRARLLLYGIDTASRNLARNLRSLSTRSAPHSATGSQASANSNITDDLVEDVVLDSDHGPIAPIAEIPVPIDGEERRRSRFAEMLDDLIHPKPDPHPDPGSDPHPGSDPTLLSSRSQAEGSALLSSRSQAEGSASCHSDPQPATRNLQPATLPTLHAVAAPHRQSTPSNPSRRRTHPKRNCPASPA